MKAKDNFKLVLEVNKKFIDPDKDKFIVGDSMIITSPLDLDEDHWQFRVKVSDKQAIVGFPKFFTIGVGFAQETNWNTNLPFSYNAKGIYEHIKENKGSDAIPDERCLKAIKMIQDVATEMEAAELEAENLIVLQNEPMLKSTETKRILSLKEFKKECKILKRNYLDTFTNKAFGTETKKREYCMFFGHSPKTNTYKYKFQFYEVTTERAIQRFYNLVRKYNLNGSMETGDNRFSCFTIGKFTYKTNMSWY